MINNRNYLIGNTFDNLNNDINKIDIDKFTKNEYEILEQLSKEQIIKISEENSKNKKENENNNIKIEEINYDLLYKLIKNINDECEKLKQIKEEKLQNSFDNEKNKNDSSQKIYYSQPLLVLQSLLILHYH